MSTSKKGETGRPDLDLDFTFHASDQMKHIDVSKKETFEGRLGVSEPKFKEGVEKTRQGLVEFKQNEKKLVNLKAFAEKSGKIELTNKADRQIIQNERMVASKTQELQRAYYFGRKGQSQDAVNTLSKSGKGRTDIVTDRIVGEETTARNKKKSRQLEDHTKLAAATGRKPLMYAPNMRAGAVRHALRKGMDVAGTQQEYHQKARSLRATQGKIKKCN